MHLQFRSWYKICLQAKARGNNHTQQYDGEPILHADSGFLIDNEAKQEIPIRSCIDITTGMASSCVVPKKGVGYYAVAELK